MRFDTNLNAWHSKSKHQQNKISQTRTQTQAQTQTLAFQCASAGFVVGILRVLHEEMQYCIEYELRWQDLPFQLKLIQIVRRMQLMHSNVINDKGKECVVY